MSEARRRLSTIYNHITGSSSAPLRMDTLPWNPDAAEFPTRENLPKIEGAPEGAAWVWGQDDYKGRVNLLTPARVKAATKEIKTGEIVTVNLPLNMPNPPGFARESFVHTIKELVPNLAHDDLYSLNTQSGTQWDGLRHVGHPHDGGLFYNNTRGRHILPDTGDTDPDRASIHHWAEHGIAGRGVLVDVWGYAKRKKLEEEQQKKKGLPKTTTTGRDTWPWDPTSRHPIPFSLIAAACEAQGIDPRPSSRGGRDLRPGDILLVRSGWGEMYRSLSREERDRLGARAFDDNVFAGVEQSREVLDWLHDGYFAAVGGDAPSFECWPARTKEEGGGLAEQVPGCEADMLHSYILALWGMPLGEMLDLEALARKCEERRCWTFFFSSVPDNCVGGVGAHVNGLCIL